MGLLANAIQNAPDNGYLRLKAMEIDETIVVDRPLRLVAENPGETVLQMKNGVGFVLKADAHLHGFVFQGEKVERASPAIEIVEADPLIESCSFERFTSVIKASGQRTNGRVQHCRIYRCGIGIMIASGASITLLDCDFDHAGIFPLVAGTQSRAVASGCSFTNTHLGGVVINEESYGEFERCEWSGSPTVADQTKRNFHAQLMAIGGGRLILRQCNLRDGNALGVHLSNGRGELSDCELTGNEWAGIQISDGSTADLRNCRVLRNGQAGVAVSNRAELTAVGLTVMGNAAAGVSVQRQAKIAVRDSHLGDNMVGIFVSGDSRGAVERCNLDGNLRGPTFAEPNAFLEVDGA